MLGKHSISLAKSLYRICVLQVCKKHCNKQKAPRVCGMGSSAGCGAGGRHGTGAEHQVRGGPLGVEGHFTVLAMLLFWAFGNRPDIGVGHLGVQGLFGVLATLEVCGSEFRAC